jgi:tetratricopeptide (TPR) repeat protein
LILFFFLKNQRKKALFTGVILLLSLLFLFVFPVFSQNPPKIACLPFVERENNEYALGYLVRDVLKMGLEQSGYFEVINSFEIETFLEGIDSSSNAFLTTSFLKQISNKLQCDYLLTGSVLYREVNNQRNLIVSPRLFVKANGEAINLASQVFQMENLSLLGKHFTEELIRTLFPNAVIQIEYPSFQEKQILPLYKAITKMKEALKTYNRESQFPDKPLWQEAFALATQATQNAPEYRESYLYLALMYHQTGWFAKEAEAWETYLHLLEQEKASTSVTKNLLATYLRLANLYLFQKKHDLALQTLKKTEELKVESSQILLLKAKILYEEDRIQEAIASLRKILNENPQHDEARYLLDFYSKAEKFGKQAYSLYVEGYKSYAAGDLFKARTLLSKATEINPEMKEAYYFLGRTLYDLGELDEAEKVWRKLLALDPFHAQAQRFLDKTIQEKTYGRETLQSFNRGLELYQKAEYRAALAFFEEAIAKNPSFQKAHEYAARCYYYLGEEKSYLEKRLKSIELLSDPKEKSRQLYDLSMEILGWGDVDQALMIAQKALQENPELHQASLLIGNLLAQKGEWKRAIDFYTQAKDDSDVKLQEEALWGRAFCLSKLEQWEESLKELNELINKFPYATFIEEAELLRLEAEARTLKLSELTEHYRQFQLRFPQSKYLDQAAFWYGYAFFKQKKYSECIQIYEDLLQKFPESTFRLQVMEMLGLCYQENKNTEKALSIFKEIGGEKGAFYQANAFYQQKDWKKAIEYFEEFLNHYPNSELSVEAQFKIAVSSLEMGELDQARKLLEEKATTFENTFPEEFYKTQIKLYAQLKNWEKVTVAGEKLLHRERKPENQKEYLLIIAWAYYHLGLEDKARELVALAGEDPEQILKDPEKEALEKASVLIDQQKYSEALEVLSEVSPDNLSNSRKGFFFLLKGKASYFTGDLETARFALEAALELLPREFQEEILLFLGEINHQQGKLEKAIENYHRLCSISQDPLYQWNLANLYHQKGDYQKNQELLQKLKNIPEYAEKAYLMHLEELYMQKEYARFLQEAFSFTQRFPQSLEREKVLYFSVWSAYYLGDEKQVEELIKEYRDLFPEGKYYQELNSLLADIYILQENYQQAIPILEELVQRAVSSEEKLYIYYRLGSIYLKMDHPEKAINFLNSVLELRPEESANLELWEKTVYLLGVALELKGDPVRAREVYYELAQKAQSEQWREKANQRIAVLEEK